MFPHTRFTISIMSNWINLQKHLPQTNLSGYDQIVLFFGIEYFLWDIVHALFARKFSWIGWIILNIYSIAKYSCDCIIQIQSYSKPIILFELVILSGACFYKILLIIIYKCSFY